MAITPGDVATAADVLAALAAKRDKELFVANLLAAGGATETNHANRLTVLINAAAEEAVTGFYVPEDFTAITSCVLVVFPNATSTQRLNFYSVYGTVGEAYNAHGENDIDVDTVMVDDQIVEIDLTGILSALAAGDQVGIRVIGDAVNVPNCYIIGVRLRYS